MKVAVVFANGMKQICLTPENADEKFALSLIGADDNISVAVKRGGFTDNSIAHINIGECNAGWLRMYDDKESTMLIISPKDK